MQLKETASAFALHGYGSPPGSDVFAAFSERALRFFDQLGIAPTYVGIEGDGYPDDFRRWGSRSHQKLLKDNFTGVSSLSIVTNPNGSDQPSYDAFATVALSFVDALGETLLYFVVNEGYLEFQTSAYDKAWKAFLGLDSWDFGYGFSDVVDKQPDFHILGLDSGKLTATEVHGLNVWYAAPVEERCHRLRGVYPYNLVSDQQLGFPLQQGTNLRQLITEVCDGEVTKVDETDLYLWRVKEASVNDVRKALQRHGAIIS